MNYLVGKESQSLSTVAEPAKKFTRNNIKFGYKIMKTIRRDLKPIVIKTHILDIYLYKTKGLGLRSILYISVSFS